MNDTYSGKDRYNSTNTPNPNELPEPAPFSPVSKNVVAGIVVFAVVALAFGPLIFRAIPPEVSRWYVASALERYEAGKKDEADQYIQKASEWDPKNLAIYELRAKIKKDAGDLNGALEIYNEALKLDPNYPLIISLRSEILFELERFSEVVDNCAKQLELLKHRSLAERRPFLNLSAYARALSNTNLELGLKEVNEALKHRADEKEHPEILDTRGLVLLQMEKTDEALVDFNLAVDTYEKFYKGILDAEKKGELPSLNRIGGKEALKNFKKSLAVIHYHRGLAFEKAVEAEKADEDFRRVKELGFEPGPKLY